MPGTYTYASLLNPKAAGSMISAVQCVQYTLAAIGITVGPDLVSKFGGGPVTTFISGVMIVSTVPAFLVVRWTVQNATKTETKPSETLEKNQEPLQEVIMN
jgi:hypothetical protein